MQSKGTIIHKKTMPIDFNFIKLNHLLHFPIPYQLDLAQVSIIVQVSIKSTPSGQNIIKRAPLEKEPPPHPIKKCNFHDPIIIANM